MTLNLSSEKMMELAKRADPNKKWERRIIGDIAAPVVPGYMSSDDEIFNPSLTGEDWQVAQACRVIVAATKIKGGTSLECYMGEYMFSLYPESGEIKTGWQPDLLTASAMALLADRGEMVLELRNPK